MLQVLTNQRPARMALLFVVAATNLAGPARLGGTRRGQAEPGRERERQVAPGLERFAARAERLTQSAPLSKGEWGLLVADQASGEVLYEQNADRYFVPASNMKLLTTALALDTLGPDYRFRTTVETNGALSPDGSLSGDLVLVGRGDPNLSNRKFPFDTKEEFDGPPDKILSELADAVVARGVKQISGDLVGDDSYFPRERYPSGWEIDDMVWEYGAAISAIAVNDNTVTVQLTPGAAAGEAVRAEVLSFAGELALKNEVLTGGLKEKPELRLTREPGAGLVRVSGTLPAKGVPRKLVLAVQEPALNAAEWFAQLLAERGVRIEGKVRAQHDPAPDEATRVVLAEHDSVRLADSVKLVNKISQNLHAELLFRATARQSGRWQDPEELVKFPAGFYTKAGIAPDDVVQTDGSGLSRNDLVTPRALVAVLRYAETQPWFPEFYASLPVAGVDGTLSDRMKSGGIVGRIHAKTGSHSHVRTLSGFAETPSGRRLVFSFLSNNQVGKNHAVQETLDELCGAMLEDLDAVPGGKAGKQGGPQNGSGTGDHRLR